MSGPSRAAYGVLGGTFDPVHLGHLEIAERVRECLALPYVLLVPATLPPHKRACEVTPPRHREAMLRLALDGKPHVELCTLELDRKKVCYTIDTLRELRRSGRGGDPVFILGTDALLGIQTWHEWSRLLAEFDLVAIDRPGAELRSRTGELDPAVASRIRYIDPSAGPGAVRKIGPGRGGRVFHVPLDPIRISSSEIRRRAGGGESLVGLVPAPVAAYIQKTRIYRTGGSSLTRDIPAEVTLAAAAALAKKAEGVVVLDLRKLSDFTDFFLICHGTADRQVLAIADGIEEQLRRECRRRPSHVEGRVAAEWVLMDYVDFVVHVFQQETRDHYRLESLWGDASRVPIEDADDASEHRRAARRADRPRGA